MGELIASQPLDQPFLGVAGFVVGTSMGAEPAFTHDEEDVVGRTLLQADPWRRSNSASSINCR